MVETIQGELTRLNELLAAEKLTPYRLGVADPKLMVPAPVNAHFMHKRVYEQLVNNIRRDGNLSTLPFCWHAEDGAIHILSGHHRIEAAVEAGVTQVLYLYTDAKLTEQERLAIQLSQNSLIGEDDMNLLRQQWQQIESLELKMYSGLDDELFKSFEPITLGAFNERDIVFQIIELVFLPPEIERLTTVLTKLKASKRLRLANLETQYDDFAEGIMRFKEAAQIFNSSTAFLVLVEAANLYSLFLEHVADMDEAAWLALHERMVDLGLMNAIEHNAVEQTEAVTQEP